VNVHRISLNWPPARYTCRSQLVASFGLLLWLPPDLRLCLHIFCAVAVVHFATLFCGAYSMLFDSVRTSCTRATDAPYDSDFHLTSNEHMQQPSTLKASAHGCSTKIYNRQPQKGSHHSTCDPRFGGAYTGRGGRPVGSPLSPLKEPCFEKAAKEGPSSESSIEDTSSNNDASTSDPPYRIFAVMRRIRITRRAAG
jgi:hypothetical protein